MMQVNFAKHVNLRKLVQMIQLNINFRKVYNIVYY